MGGKGESVSYSRIRATTKRQRDKLKQDIGEIIDDASEAITVIALVEEPEENGKGRSRAKSRRKKRARRAY
jgi:hypothetical protein